MVKVNKCIKTWDVTNDLVPSNHSSIYHKCKKNVDGNRLATHTGTHECICGDILEKTPENDPTPTVNSDIDPLEILAEWVKYWSTEDKAPYIQSILVLHQNGYVLDSNTLTFKKSEEG